MGTANIKVIGNNNVEYYIRALCDNGSQVNLITQRATQLLNVTPNSVRTTFIGIGGNKLGSSLGEVSSKIELKNRKILTCNFFVVKNITSYFPNSKHNWPNLKGQMADEGYNQSGKINALLGVGIWIQILEPGVIKSKNLLAIAQQTKWVM